MFLEVMFWNGKFILMEGKFPLGKICLTAGVKEEVNLIDQIAALKKHHNGDWGNVCSEDWESNDEALKEGFRLLSSYTSSNGIKFWIITEADRSATTFLLPEEY